MSMTSTHIDPTTIDNVKRWYGVAYPTEFQVDGIDPGLSFAWIGENFCDRRACSERLHGLDTMVRECICHEALVRKVRALKSEGRTELELLKFAWKMSNLGGFTPYGVERVFEDAGMSGILGK